MARARPRQLSLELRTHGGARAGADRKPNGAKAGVRHCKRGELGGSVPLLVTLKLLQGIGNLRTRARCHVVLRTLQKVKDRFGTRLVELSVQHDPIHMIVEASDAKALSRAMQGLAVRVALQLNRSLGRRGNVFADRYHHRALTTPRQVRNALAYVVCNARKHEVAPHRCGWLDPLSTVASFDSWTHGAANAADRVTPAPRTWLLRVGWRRRGLIDPDHVPGSMA
jgi:REP element-mobilizing transposase RayT